MSGVLYKRIPPPPDPEDDPSYPRSPTSPSTSPSYEYPGYETVPDYIPDVSGLTINLSDERARDIPDESGLTTNFLDDGIWDGIPHESGLATNFSDDGSPKTPRSGIIPNFDSLDDDDHDNTFSKEDLDRQTNQFVTAALDHYNSQEGNMIKYELIKAITSTGIMDGFRIYGHVNFIAKSSLENSKEEFFFAELCYLRNPHICVPTCIVSLEGKEQIGGVRGVKGNDGYYGTEIRVDTRHCYACKEELMHPEDGTLYEIGHHVDAYYGSCCS